MDDEKQQRQAAVKAARAAQLKINNEVGDAFERKIGDALAASDHNYDWQRQDGGTTADFEIFDADGDRMAIVEAKGGESWGREGQLQQLIDRTADRTSYVTPEGEHLLVVVTEDGHMPAEAVKAGPYAESKGVKIISTTPDQLADLPDIKELQPAGEYLNQQSQESGKAWLSSQSQDWIDSHSSEIKGWIEKQGANALETVKELKNGSQALSNWVDREAKSTAQSNPYPEAKQAIQQAASAEQPAEAKTAPPQASTKLDAAASGERAAARLTKGTAAPQPKSFAPKAASAGGKPAASPRGAGPASPAPKAGNALAQKASGTGKAGAAGGASAPKGGAPAAQGAAGGALKAGPTAQGIGAALINKVGGSKL